MKKNLILSIFLILSIAITQADDTEDFDSNFRIENEYKLAVDPNDKDKIWDYLLKRYQGNDSFIKNVHSDFNVEFSEEIFIDRYFDDQNLKMYNLQNGLRHRTRFIPGDENNKKNGRSLVQLKLNNIDNNELNRGEIKFKVRKDLIGPSDSSLAALLNKHDLDLINSKLNMFDADVKNMSEKIRLKQIRKRVYISFGLTPFATITLDTVESKILWKTNQFIEMEIELNEVGYTNAQSSERKKMDEISKSIKDDLFLNFPKLIQDQTPKYNKAFGFFLRLIENDKVFGFFHKLANIF